MLSEQDFCHRVLWIKILRQNGGCHFLQSISPCVNKICTLLRSPKKMAPKTKSGEVVFLIQMSTFIFFWLLRKLKVLGISMNLSCFLCVPLFYAFSPLCSRTSQILRRWRERRWPRCHGRNLRHLSFSALSFTPWQSPRVNSGEVPAMMRGCCDKNKRWKKKQVQGVFWCHMISHPRNDAIWYHNMLWPLSEDQKIMPFLTQIKWSLLNVAI